MGGALLCVEKPSTTTTTSIRLSSRMEGKELSTASVWWMWSRGVRSGFIIGWGDKDGCRQVQGGEWAFLSKPFFIFLHYYYSYPHMQLPAVSPYPKPCQLNTLYGWVGSLKAKSLCCFCFFLGHFFFFLKAASANESSTKRCSPPELCHSMPLLEMDPEARAAHSSIFLDREIPARAAYRLCTCQDWMLDLKDEHI